MGFGAVITSSIMIILSLIIIAFVAINIIMWANYLNTMSSHTVEEIGTKLNVNLRITGSKYNDTLNTLSVNITNVGSEPVLLGPKTDIILDYIDVDGVRRIELLKPSSWSIDRVYVGNSTLTVPKGVYIELAPGMIVCLKITPTYQIQVGEVVKIVIALPVGVKAEYVFIPS